MLLRLCLWVLLCSAFNTPALAQSANLDTDPALKLHFDFDEDFSNGRVLDVSGNGNDGWQFDSTNWISPGTGVFGSTAAQFEYAGLIYTDPPRVHAYSQYIGITNVTGFFFLTNATLSVWAKFDTNADNAMVLLDTGYPVMYAFDPNAASNSWSWARNSSSYLYFTTYPSDVYHRFVVSWPDDTVQPGGFSPNFATISFHLYTLTVDCTSNYAIAYYDGQPYTTNTIDLPWLRVYGTLNRPWISVGALSHDGTPEWGDDAYPNAGFFVGRMDDLRIYNRTLSAAEVQALYDGAPLVKGLSVRQGNPGSIQVCWSGHSNTLYQVDHRVDFATPWSPFGSPLLGAGATNCVSDSLLGQTNGFYRVRALH
jgi:hypothetical protein